MFSKKLTYRYFKSSSSISSNWVTVPRFLPRAKDEIDVSTSSSGNVSSYRLSFRVKTEILNRHHCHRSPSPNSPTPTLHCYKVILTLATIFTTQSRLYFGSSLIRAPHHQSSTHRRRSLSSPSHTHHPSAQQHPQWWRTSRPPFVSQTAYPYVNSCKTIF
jgi:hypothetical protein